MNDIERTLATKEPCNGWLARDYENGVMVTKDGRYMFEINEDGMTATREGYPFVKDMECKGYFDYPEDMRRADTEKSVEDFLEKYTDEDVKGTVDEKTMMLYEENGFGHEEHVTVVELFHEKACEYSETVIYGNRYYQVTGRSASYIDRDEFDESEREYREFLEECEGEEPQDELEESWEELEHREWMDANGLF